MSGAAHRAGAWCLPQWAMALLLIAVMLGGAQRAAGEPEPMLTVEVGHAGTIRRNSYFPIRVAIDWISKPDEPLTGDAQPARLRANVPQDLLYSAVISRDVTIQPGKTTSAVLYARSQTDFMDCEVELLDQRGRTLARARLNSSGLGGWRSVDGDEAIVMVVGRSSLPRSGWVFDHQNVSPVRVEERKPGELPREWPGYDGVTVVLLEDFQSEHLDALQIKTLLEWVGQGGHLVVSTTNQLDTFNEVLGDQRWSLTFGEYNAKEFDPGIVNALRGALKQGLDPDPKVPNWGREILSVNPNAAMGWFNQYMADVLNECAAFNGRFLYSRPIALSADAIEAGWSARLAEERFNSLERHDGEDAIATGDIVTGPFGLGSVTILGIDPASLAGGNAHELRGVGWWHCLDHIEALRDAVSGSTGTAYSYFGESQDAMLRTSAINSMLDSLCAGFGVSRGLFGAISIALLLLVLLIGPVDYFVLRWWRREPLTWITCPALVLLACGAIYFAQESVSYGRARASRLNIVDAWSGATRGVGTSLTAIASARGGGYRLDGITEGRYVSPVCWSPPRWSYYGSDPATTEIAIDQTSMGTRVRSIAIPLENVRWLQERGPVDAPAITGTVQFDQSHDRLMVDVAAPPDAACRVAAVMWNDGWYVSDSNGVPLTNGRLTGARFDRAEGDRESAKWRRGRLNQDTYIPDSEWLKGWTRDLAFQIPGHRILSKRLKDLGTDYAAILITIDGRSGVELMRGDEAVDAEWREETRLRLMVPATRMPVVGGGNQP